jgi:hypothetical protein
LKQLPDWLKQCNRYIRFTSARMLAQVAGAEGMLAAGVCK